MEKDLKSLRKRSFKPNYFEFLNLKNEIRNNALGKSTSMAPMVFKPKLQFNNDLVLIFASNGKTILGNSLLSHKDKKLI